MSGVIKISALLIFSILLFFVRTKSGWAAVAQDLTGSWVAGAPDSPVSKRFTFSRDGKFSSQWLGVNVRNFGNSEQSVTCSFEILPSMFEVTESDIKGPANLSTETVKVYVDPGDLNMIENDRNSSKCSKYVSTLRTAAEQGPLLFSVRLDSNGNLVENGDVFERVSR